jgi:DNA-binding GntR family transcriptional regulator
MVEPIAFPPPLFRPLFVDAYDALQNAILTGKLPPGARIVEAEIARQMGISRAPIREAIRKLERDGMVRYVPRRGTIVIQLTRDEIVDIYYLRAHLEAYAVRLAAERALPEEFDLLDEMITRMCQHADQNDVSSLVTVDAEFHGAICKAARNKHLLNLWESLNPRSWTLLTNLEVSEDFGLMHIAERHRLVLDALRSRDADSAEKAIRHHIIELAEHVVVHLAQEARQRRGHATSGYQG